MSPLPNFTLCFAMSMRQFHDKIGTPAGNMGTTVAADEELNVLNKTERFSRFRRDAGNEPFEQK
jgi:hypothetical protein